MSKPRSSDATRTTSQSDRSSTSSSASSHAPATNAHIKAEITGAQERLERVAQNFSIEWKKFLAYAMAIKQSAEGAESNNATANTSALDLERKNGLEDLLLQSQSGLVMLREMTHRRAHKWQEVAQSHGYRSLDSDPSNTESPIVKQSQPTTVARLIAYNKRKAQMSRLILSRKENHHGRESQRKQQQTSFHHAAVKMLAEATHNQHRLSHAVGVSVDPMNLSESILHHSLHVIQPEDMEQLVSFTHAKLKASLPFERLFVRMKWLCTSHRFHVRKRMLALFHQQKAKNTPASPLTMVEKIKNLSVVTAASGQMVVAAAALHCPLFVLSSIQLEAELSNHLQRHQLQLASFCSSSMGASFMRTMETGGGDCGANGLDIVTLKVLINELFDQSMKANSVDLDLKTTASPDSDTEQAESESSAGDTELPSLLLLEQMQPFYAQTRVESHWDVRQLDVLECSSSRRDTHEIGGGSRVPSSLSASHEFDDDPLLRNEWGLLRLSDKEYLRTRVDALARRHFDRAQVDLRSSSNSNNSKSVGSRPSSSSKPIDKSKQIVDYSEQDKQLLVLPSDANGNEEELMSPETIAMLYLLRIVSCRAKRVRLLRLLNYFHFIVLSRQGGCGDNSVSDHTNSTTGRHTSAAKSSASPQHRRSSAPQWRVEKRQSDFVVVENTRDASHHQPRSPGPSDSDSRGAGSERDEHSDREFVFPAARQDLETMERHMLRIASVFVRRQERDSLPSLREASSALNLNQNQRQHVMVVDRMQVICDIYDCELNFLQAKLQLVEYLLKNGFEFSEDAVDDSHCASSNSQYENGSSEPATHTNALLSVLQRRPLIDFSHAYFFESYAAETLHLELQTSLQQQIHDHFAKCNAGEESDDSPMWLGRQMIHVDLLSRLHRHQKELMKEAEQRWFCVSAVGELHALHQAIYEKMLISWKLIVSVELSTAPAQCLEQSGDGVLSGRGWQVVFPPKLVTDCCQNLQQPSRDNAMQSSDLSPVETMIRALAVTEWHQEFGRKVYEANLLERVYRFQYDFVGQKDSSDSISQFFFSCNGTTTSSSSSSESKFSVAAGPPQAKIELNPIVLDLLGEREFAILTTKNVASTSKTVPEWLEAQLTSSHLLEELGGNGCTIKAHWKAQFLDFQVRWTRFLAAAVRYQDLIGAEIFEFASCSPFLFLDSRDSNSSSHDKKRRDSNQNTSGGATLNAKVVQSKYAEEIAEKMKEEMHQNCYPYWISLEQLKGQLKKRFNGTGGFAFPVSSRQSFLAVVAVDTSANPNANGDEALANDPDNNESPTFSIDAMMQSYAPRFEACAQFMTAEAAVPEALVRVNQYLKRFRNERALMQTQSSAVFSVCAFTPNRVSEEHDSHKKNTLTRWLTSKLQQLRQDLQTSASYTTTTTNQSGLAGFDAAKAPTLFGEKAGVHGGGSEENQLLLSLPSQLYLIDQFAVPMCRDQPSPAFSKAFALANDERVATLRSLSLILEAFHTGMDLIRVKSSFHFGMKHYKSSSTSSADGGGKRHQTLKARRSPPAHGLLERWQTYFHEEIRSFHDHIVDSLAHPSLASCNIYARNNDNKVKLANKSQLEALQVIRNCVDTRNVELTGFLQCMTSFLLMQTIRNTQFDDRGEVDTSEAAANQRNAHRKSLQRCLLDLSTRLTVDAENRGIVQRLDRSEYVVGACVSPVVSSASESLLLFYRASTTRSATQSDREVFAFWEKLGNLQHDTTYLACLASWLDLQRVFVAEHIRPALPLLSHCDGGSILNAASFELEVSAIAALDKLWERYELIVPEHEYSDVEELSAGAISEAEPDHQTQQPSALLRGERSQMARSGPQMCRQGSFTQRRDLMAFNISSSSPATMLLPSQSKLLHQLEFLRLHFELQWLQADIIAMEHHYKSFLNQKKRSQQNGRIANGSSHQYHHHRRKNEMLSPTLMALSKFYRSGGNDGSTDGSNQSAGGQLTMVTRHCGEFVIPASEMNILLQDLAAECTQHHWKQAEVYEHTIQNLQRQLTGAHHSLETLQHKSKCDTRQEEIKRESYAIDHTYQLQFQMAQLKKEVEAMENRMDLERLSLQCQLSDEYETKLATMHAQLLAKQQRFDEYRVVMQHDLHVQLQGAQTQLAHQLIDHSGSISVEMKANFLANLHGQHVNDHAHKENVALKQTLLKLQSLLEMQQQTHGANQEREQMLHRRHKTANLMLRNETAQLQQQIKQLEADMSKLSQEKTFYMLKWNTLQKQTESLAQKKREAKIRALSAPYHHATAAALSPFPHMEELEKPSQPKSTAAGVGVLGSSSKHKSRALQNFEDEEEAFENYHEVAIRRQTPRLSSADSDERDDTFTSSKPDDNRSERHFQNSARHYQNEIRRLQQQLAKETKSKAMLMDQVTQLKALHPIEADNQTLEGGDTDNPEAQSSAFVKADGSESSQAHGSGLTLRMMNLPGEGGTRAPSAGYSRMLTSPSSSPRVRAQSASICTPARPQQPSTSYGGSGSGIASKRPSTSFSPRASSLYLTQAAATGTASPRSAGLPPPASTPSQATPGTPMRKFEVQKRSEPKIGGIEGVPNILSVREPLPYR